eukprot:1111182-Pyramimonas_sp.AAC.1
MEKSKIETDMRAVGGGSRQGCLLRWAAAIGRGCEGAAHDGRQEVEKQEQEQPRPEASFCQQCAEAFVFLGAT